MQFSKYINSYANPTSQTFMGQCSNQRKEPDQLHVTKLSAILNATRMFSKILHFVNGGLYLIFGSDQR